MDKEDKSDSYKISVKCYLDTCNNEVDVTVIPVKGYRYEKKTSTFMCLTERGFRNRSSHNNFLCSKDCLSIFKKTKRCNNCCEIGDNCKFVDELGYSLCINRADGGMPCLINLELMKKLRDQYKDINYSNRLEIVPNLIHTKLPRELKDNIDLVKLIKINSNLISLSILTHMADASWNYDIREDIPEIEENCKYCQKKMEDMDNIYYVYNDGAPYITCCYISKYMDGDVCVDYVYEPPNKEKKESYEQFILELSMYERDDDYDSS